MRPPLRIDDEFRSDVGLVRSANEDSLAALSREQVWVVADGMGGHDHGKLASSSIVAALEAATIPEEMGEACDAVADAIQAANAESLAEAKALGSKMGSTVVALVVRDRQFAVLWAGDSRAYVFRGRELHQLTHDHTQVQEMVDRGLLTAEEAAGHPMAHVLARAVGVVPVLEIDAVSDEALPDDIFLLCSDGLHGVLSAEEIAEILAQSGRSSVEPLITACIARGAPDNISVILVRASEPTNVVLAGGLNA
jgi:serine/threonine protein phosphatase PrpC